ncbi:hypothetical protein [Ancylobacter sp. TS-1]|nr:hypothetical protein [Ancylobacter sp. TS-1]
MTLPRSPAAGKSRRATVRSRDAAIINALVVATLVIGIARMVALAGQW